MWIGADDKECCYDKENVLCGLERMWKEIFRQIWYYISIARDLIGCCHDLIWGAFCIGTDVEEYSHDLTWSAMWIRTDDRGWSNDLTWGAL
jgi:hypothetical protein